MLIFKTLNDKHLWYEADWPRIVNITTSNNIMVVVLIFLIIELFTFKEKYIPITFQQKF